MTKYEMLWNLPIAVTALSCLVMIFSALLRKDRVVLASGALVLANANSAPVVEITANLGLGLGTAWFLIGLVGLVLIICYRLNIEHILFAVPNRTGFLLAWFAFYFFLIFSPIVALDRSVTIRRAFSFMLVFIVGWRIFGLVFRQRPELTRSRLYAMIYTTGAWGIVAAIATLLVMGPRAMRAEIGGARSLINLGGHIVSRLQGGFLRATGLAEMTASAIFLVVHWIKTGSRMRRLKLLGLLALLALIFLWAAGRTAMVAFWVTILVLGFMEFLTARSKTKPAFLLLLFGVLPVLLWGLVAPLLLREGMDTIWQTLVQARLDGAMQGLRLYKPYLVWGTGSGTLLGSFEAGDLAVESFFFRVLIEFGLIGGTLYVLAWLSITLFVLRTDFYYLRRGQPGAWLPSVGFIMTWAASPTSFGFSVFNGSMALSLAIGAAAMVDWIQIKRAARQGVDHLTIQQNRPAGVVMSNQS